MVHFYKIVYNNELIYNPEISNNAIGLRLILNCTLNNKIYTFFRHNYSRNARNFKT